MSVNKAILIGRLGKDPELRYTPSGKAVVSFPLATTDRWTDQNGERKESTTWHNIVAWGRQAELMNEYLRKGRQVYIEGRIDNRSYEDKDGNRRYISEVVVQNFQFLGARDDAGAPPPAANAEAPAASGPETPAESADDDLPF